MTQFLFGTGAAVVRTMQEAFHAIQQHPKTRAVMRFYFGAQMRQHGLHFAPVNVAADRALENGSQQAFVLVTHGWLRYITRLQDSG